MMHPIHIISVRGLCERIQDFLREGASQSCMVVVVVVGGRAEFSRILCETYRFL